LQCTGRKPAKPHQLRDAARIVAVALDRHRLKRVPHMAGFQKLDYKPGLPHRRIEPLRQRRGLQPDPRNAKSKRAKPRDQRLRLACNLALANDLAGGVHNAHTRVFQ